MQTLIKFSILVNDLGEKGFYSAMLYYN